MEAVWSREEKSRSRLPRLASPSTAQHSKLDQMDRLPRCVAAAAAVTSNVAAAGTQTLGISREQCVLPSVCPVQNSRLSPAPIVPPIAALRTLLESSSPVLRAPYEYEYLCRSASYPVQQVPSTTPQPQAQKTVTPPGGNAVRRVRASLRSPHSQSLAHSKKAAWPSPHTDSLPFSLSHTNSPIQNPPIQTAPASSSQHNAPIW
ncbi:hypothetical protein CFAM422_002389 [Trichoderma lentiforme]|uniref:Uncharacterized protein n=1 Tax=Trichoderma lentiforme TaxID=1567552 RepID=A0A9P4XMN5_9HYPO|nr:hypothetical protein CFAM422_002389 [Trichoderma lentiforme]